VQRRCGAERFSNKAILSRNIIRNRSVLNCVRDYSVLANATWKLSGTPSRNVRFFSWAAVTSGAPETTEFRIKYKKDGSTVSPWHGIPLKSGNLFHYVNEIPKGSRAKMEISTKEADNPIKQDIKKGKLRYFTYGDIPFNYGAIPQTFEDPSHVHPDTKFKGDGDPIDVVEVGGVPIPMGSIVKVKVLGLLALIDEEETDWKILAVAENSPLYAKLNDVGDIEKATVDGVRNWFKMYKTTDGKPENKFAFDGAVKNKQYAERIVAETHESWKLLCANKLGDLGMAIPGGKK